MAQTQPTRTQVIACGALAREIVELVRLNNLEHLEITCLPAEWHNYPHRIPEGVRGKIRAAYAEGFGRVLVAYGDCGTGGLLDKVLQEEGAERIGGDHCYAFYRGLSDFQRDFDADPTCFYLTDYLARHFDRLIVKGLALDRHPELLKDYFGNYTTLVFLAQTDNPELDLAAEAAARRLELSYRRVATGYGELASFLVS